MANFLDDYEPVEDRLRDFWSDHPDGRVMTTLLSSNGADGDYIVYAEVWRSAGDLPAASGLAHDSAMQLPPTMKASALEVCETSAIGRALANLGYAAKGKRPSREEMSKASGSVAGESPNPPVEKTALDPSPDTSPASLGEVGAGTSSEGKPGAQGPGVDSAIGTTPGPTKGYPLAPEKCDHRARGGYWLKTQVVDGQARCPRCGLAAVKYRETA